jgi:hypothetical protein
MLLSGSTKVKKKKSWKRRMKKTKKIITQDDAEELRKQIRRLITQSKYGGNKAKESSNRNVLIAFIVLFVFTIVLFARSTRGMKLLEDLLRTISFAILDLIELIKVVPALPPLPPPVALPVLLPPLSCSTFAFDPKIVSLPSILCKCKDDTRCIRNAKKVASVEYHPDKNKGKPECVAAFTDIQNVECTCSSTTNATCIDENGIKELQKKQRR